MFFTLPAQLPSLGPGWTTTLELRGRYERRDDADFEESASDNSATLFTRGRLGLSYKVDALTSARFVYQFAASDMMPTVGSGSDVVAQDLIEAALVRRAGSSVLTVGRQKVNLGGQRLIGALEWANSSRSWLGVRLDNGDWKFFWGELESNPVPNPHAQIAMASRASAFGETSVIYKHDTMPAMRTSVTTIDHRYVGKFGGSSITAEGAYQWGRKGGKDQDAWAGTVRADFPVGGTVAFYAEGNIATGGGSATVNRSFDNLYPTNHLYYGMMDLQGWSNMKGFAVGVKWRPKANLDFDLSYHDFSLYDDTDGWYGASGAINRLLGVPYIDPTGSSGSHVGSEIDIVARWRPSATMAVEGGFAVFSPGQFVKSFVGGPTTASTFGYVQVGLRF